MKTYAPHQQRVINEKTELETRATALDEFIEANPIFRTLDGEEQGRLIDQKDCMDAYLRILAARIDAFGPPDYAPPPHTKATLVAAHKTFRQKLDGILQELKSHRRTMSDIQAESPNPIFDNHGEAIAQHIISIRDLESAIMSQGMVLKNVGNPDPYPLSKDPSSPVVEPTADGLKL